MANIVIGCRLPNGLILEVPGKPDVELAGQNSAQAGSPIILLSERDCGYTEVDEDFWKEWKATHPKFKPLESQAIFEAKNRTEAKAIHKEVKKEATGHEPTPQVEKNIEKA